MKSKKCKDVLKFMACAATAVCLCAVAACTGDGGGGGPAESQFPADVTLESAEYVYDGSPHSLTVSGTLPEGTEVAYRGNGQTDVGQYDVSASLSCSGYATTTLTAVLTISPAEFSDDIVLESDRVLYDGREHSLEVSGELPEGTMVTYEGNGGVEAGEYTVTATLENANYVTKKLTATLVIYTVTDAAAEVVDALLERPDPFSFLPDAFSEENLAYDSAQTEDFSGFVDTSSLLTRFTGRQMHVVQGVLSRSSAILSGADIIFTAGEAIAQVYRSFIDNNPDDYDEFSTQLPIAGSTFDISISVSETTAALSASNGAISISLNSDTSSSAVWRNSGYIELGDTGVLKYGFSEDALSLALKFTLAGVSYMQYLEFERADGQVTGELTEFIGIEESVNTKTSALIYSDEETTSVISNKRESSDLPVNAFVEVYSSVNGAYLAGEVKETVEVLGIATDYDTVWVPLGSVSGITGVRVTDKEENADNKLNSNSVYINGSSTPLVPEYNTIPFVGTRTSRHYDIELRTVWYYVLTEDGVEEREVSIPMLFVQRENIDDFTEEMYKNNEVNATLPLGNIALAEEIFDSYSEAYEAYKEQVTYTWLSEYIANL